MAKYDVYPSEGATGYLLDVQTDFMDNYETRVVVPLIPIELAPKAAYGLNPIFEIESEQFVMVTQYLSSVPTTALGTPAANLSEKFAEITGALDFLFQGF